ncbi:PilZ domain-containing protein [Janthinobacterium sp. 17J80-10]|uniref:PilZ domain-containing protein n=1 Tax=Janthinobacterium sp. 17J80-10 TaxID=2497863 RepID=UPI0013E8E8C4|nr:PilZ domain-containing protein [Janthinobacterium sp. 17J80-10]
MAVDARMLGHDAIPHHIQIMDISRGGIGLVAQAELQAGDTCAIAFDATVDEEPRRINVWAKVAYCVPLTAADFQIGVHFRDYDTHSRTHIEQLCGTYGLPVGW